MLKVIEVGFKYGNTSVLSDVSFSLKAGKTLAVVGESGSGKSSLLKLIYGEHEPSFGKISWKNKAILGPKNMLIIGQDYMKYLPQEFDLMPYATVAENIGTYLSNFFPKKKELRTKELLDVVGLSNYSNRKVVGLSGGQKQRVALAKAIAQQPEVLLLDEPFSHIDNFKKQSLRRNLFAFLKYHNIAVLIATHDKNDILPFADKMIVLNNGFLIRSGKPEELYKDPKTPIVASFFGEYSTIKGKIFYAHQLSLQEDGAIKAIVIDCFFMGTYFLIRAKKGEKTILFNHPVALRTNTAVSLKIS